MDIQISDELKKNVFILIRNEIASDLGLRINDNVTIDDPILDEKYGAFVTLHIHGQLRGCIGFIVGYRPLRETLSELSKLAAFKDPRFPPLSVDEYDDIDIEVSILSPIQNLGSPEDIVIGKHGLIIKKGFKSGLLLPQVATENNWQREQFLSHTCLKAGLPPDAWKDKDTELQYFTAYVFGEKEISGVK
ncbi:MAG TPA: AmmeMemoRadiSam system protein A [Spirochaetota bacterium]|nr:AmmeMemoRadiSam system protein A [Spirochaetota bacterium]